MARDLCGPRTACSAHVLLISLLDFIGLVVIHIFILLEQIIHIFLFVIL